ncbi:phosphatidylglycerophosphatase A family protein [Gorillibacterium timonense]|uniref:phosphatidylglycerophosphatase A family protein n=1 Tax=Gorillibacterium timonense TaxID=1689269 RepID=UPI00071C6C7C|nr:phosphatidylglycerophosphatase A [Gorillibacterium timonense]
MAVKYNLDSAKVEKAAREWLSERGVKLEQIAKLVLDAQREYYPQLTEEECLAAVNRVLSKREVQNAVLLGIQLDRLAEAGTLESPLQELIENDEKLFGCDEVLALSIVNVYGSIGFTNYGYLDKLKPGILAKLNDKTDNECHTFLDDLVGAIAASACSYIAHRQQAKAEQERSGDAAVPTLTASTD